MKNYGYFDVSDDHKLYYEVYGNPNGIPVLFLHGGPGVGFSERDKRFFDENKFKVLFFDQRGASRSKPFGSIKNNNTDLLVEDIDRLTHHFKFSRFLIFGGSWGSTLALVYAIRNPHRVTGLLLRGIFLANKDSIDHYINGGVRKHYPEAWQKFIDKVPQSQNDISEYYYKKMTSEDESLAKSFAYEWAKYEMSIYKMGMKEEEIQELIHTIPYESLSRLEAHYITHNCFLPDNYILDNIDKIQGIKTVIVQGRYDAICPPVYAYQLHESLDNSSLYLVEAGHASSETTIENQLIHEVNYFKN